MRARLACPLVAQVLIHRGHLGPSFRAAGCSERAGAWALISLISGTKRLNAGRMQIFEEV